MPMMQLNVITSFTDQEKLGWNWLINGKLKGKITNTNRNQIDRYFTLFEEHIAPKSNALIAIVELKRLFQGSMSLEDIHTKVLRLVTEPEYPEGDTWNSTKRHNNQWFGL